MIWTLSLSGGLVLVQQCPHRAGRPLRRLWAEEDGRPLLQDFYGPLARNREVRHPQSRFNLRLAEVRHKQAVVHPGQVLDVERSTFLI